MSLSKKRPSRKANPQETRQPRTRRRSKAAGAASAGSVSIRLRDQHERGDDGLLFAGDDPAEVFRRVIEADLTDRPYPIIEVLRGDVALVDLDTHHLERRPNTNELAAWAESVAPQPDAWWPTHGKGLRLVFFGPGCEERALAAAFSVPKWFEVELKRDSRHPEGAHPDYPGVRCGAIHFRTTSRGETIDWLATGRLDEKAVDDLLAAREMRQGGRYSHEFCPIDGQAESSAGDCVVAFDAGIYCYRCASKGICFESCQTPGLASYSALADGTVRLAVLHSLARNFVHWAHAELHLRQEYPNLARKLLRQAYDLTLRAAHGDEDPRIPSVFNPDLRLLQGEHTWFDRETGKEVRATEYTLNALPGLLRLSKKTNENGETKVTLKVRAPLIDRAKSGIPLDGYTPVRFVRGLALHEDDSVLQAVVGPMHGQPVKLLAGKLLLPADQALAELGNAFPGLSRSYFQGSLAGAICAARGGRPPIIMAVGPTGSGKGETPRLAASFLADERQTLAVVKDEERMWRRIGSAVEAGRMFLFFDEFLRRGNILPELITLVLQLGSTVTWRRLYANADIQTANRAAYFLAAGCVPDGFKKSPEIRRRTWLARLHRQVEDWEQTSNGDTAEWRARSKRNAQIANSILTYTYHLCAEHDFNFDRVAEALGLCRIDEGEAELQHGVLRDLFRHCRNQFSDRVLHTAKRYQSGRWVDALSGPCQELLQQLVPDEDTDRPDQAGLVFQLQQNLQMIPWNTVLAIDDPPILCEMRRHGGWVAIRFRETGGQLRGRERINEDLPPIPGDDPEDRIGDGGGVGRPGPADSGGDPLCQPCQEGWHNGNPPDAAENAENEPAQTRSASNASSATYYKSDRENNDESARAGAGEDKRSAKSLAQLAQRDSGPAIGGGVPLSPALSLAQPLAQRPRPDGVGGPDYATALSAAGFPPQLLVIDFETYFDTKYSLKKLTMPEYVHDARFHTHGLAVRRPDGRCEFRTDANAALVDLRAEYGDRLQSVTVAAHHAHFDLFILAKKYDLRPAYVTDTLSMARHVFPGVGNKLADLAARFGLAPKGDALMELEGVREPDVVQAAKLAAYAKHDANLCHDIASRLLPRISRPDVEIRLIDHTIRLFTERALPLDLPNARRLLREAQERLQEVLDATGVDRKTAGGNGLVELLADELAKDGLAVPTKPGKNGDIPALAKGDDGMRQLLDDRNPQVRCYARARLAVKSAPQVENRLKTMIRIAEATGGELPTPLKYCGCHTGRYSGDGGINLQNLPAHVKGLASRIRSLLLAGDGHRLVMVDAAQIEARVLAWFAGQDDLLREFAQKGDPYSRFATNVFGEPIRKPKDSDSQQIKDYLGPRRQLGKVCILELGYQAGAPRLIESVRSKPEVAPLFASGVLTDAFLTEVHREYRQTYSGIVRAWYAAQNAFASAVHGGRGVAGCVEFTRDSDAVYMHLPSGRKLFYPDPEIPISGEMRYLGGKIYGGLLVENLCQAISRDILVEAMLALEERGYPTVLTVHDEIVLRVRQDLAEAALRDAKSALSSPPEWASGLPLGAEGRVDVHYGK